MRLFFFFMAFLTCFYTMISTLCLVNLFFYWNFFPFSYFGYLSSAFRVVHLSVVCPHVPWYWQNFLPLCYSYESLSSESPKVTTFHFLDPFLDFFLFLEEILSRIDYSSFQSLSQRILP